MTSAVIGIGVPQADLRDKLTGDARYSAGRKLPGMLIGQVLRRPRSHSGVLSIDTRLTLPGPPDCPE